ncbi:DUF2243 domain-containing protein [Ramlibacter tataouinensis]|uniref:Candidate membrane protein n=1 Tax=Ramlibacter tataouinensis (strain ATCC BAA-407 / DSM 14655 / LMG 21543 / TTB310) TaxID=365046 RepID=F5Y374_RAMTT|nr:DUF2243 domain-containing protein [Ramlibacter tataouinensis]AEG91161.1 candidate membrane protein [Ramlibacter tataouinensis TTB310]
MAASSHLTSPPSPGRPGFLLGLALGGFFDGILLHQVLQWHHLLSGLDDGPLRDLRLQILADGLFHAAMYLVAAAGLLLLWRARAALGQAGAGRRLLAAVLAGFGGWHVLDTLLSHWLTGIHRVRMDVADPLPWDLLWLALFGLLPLAAAAWLRRGAARGPGAGVAAVAVAALAVVAGLQAAQPPAGGDDLLVVFRPGVGAAQAMAVLGRIDARVVWTDRGGAVWAVKASPQAPVGPLYRGGALLVSRSAVSLGCLSWSQRAGR